MPGDSLTALQTIWAIQSTVASGQKGIPETRALSINYQHGKRRLLIELGIHGAARPVGQYVLAQEQEYQKTCYGRHCLFWPVHKGVAEHNAA